MSCGKHFFYVSLSLLSINLLVFLLCDDAKLIVWFQAK